MDLTHSFLAAAGANVEGLEGIDLLGKAAAGKEPEDRTLYWRSRRGERTWRAIRDKNWKYIKKIDEGKTEEWIFNLKQDPTETKNKLEIGSAAKKLTRLKKKLAQWEEEVTPER
jgi:N-acetylgalactosamine-6-sulfatase